MTNKTKVTVVPDSQIETIRLRSGTWIARPNGCLGNVGWSPCAWLAAYGTSADDAIRSFYTINPNIVRR